MSIAIDWKCSHYPPYPRPENRGIPRRSLNHKLWLDLRSRSIRRPIRVGLAIGPKGPEARVLDYVEEQIGELLKNRGITLVELSPALEKWACSNSKTWCHGLLNGQEVDLVIGGQGVSLGAECGPIANHQLTLHFRWPNGMQLYPGFFGKRLVTTASKPLAYGRLALIAEAAIIEALIRASYTPMPAPDAGLLARADAWPECWGPTPPPSPYVAIAMPDPQHP